MDNAASSDTLTQTNDAVIIQETPDDDVNLLVFTILNVTSEPTKLLIAYMFTIVTTIIMYISIFCFWRGTHTWFDSHGRYNSSLNDMGYS